MCISYQDTQQINHALKAFFKEKGRWSWAVYVTVETPYSRCIADGVFEEVESKKFGDPFKARSTPLTNRTCWTR